MNFHCAIEALNDGVRVARQGWPGNSFVVVMPGMKLPPFNTQGTDHKVNDRTAKWIGKDRELDCQPYFAHYDAHTNKWQPGWTPSTEDMFAEDWTTIGEGV